ncbi:hypothetical protein [Flavobacterium sp.]|uniref:hypothetical protein n=1 Tax=Flavobacterium sp. TaxID=239 RepID=UPI0039E32928
MIRKFRKYLKVVDIDMQIYSMTKADWSALAEIGMEVQTEQLSDGRTRYFIMDQDIFAHQSFLFPKLNILKLIQKKGPAIGDCVTMADYKGRNIYPYVINRIAGEVLAKGKHPEVFIVVTSNNARSIRGIVKAGFRLHTSIKAKRFLLYYFNLDLQKFR